MKKRRQEITREKYFLLRNLAYDYREIQKKEEEFCRQQPFGKGFLIYHAPPGAPPSHAPR
jgi:hypothetical protein